MSTQTLPKAAQKFVDDAKAAGFTVKVNSWGVQNGGSQYHEITVEKKTESGFEFFGYAQWMTQNVAGMNSRLGFATEYIEGMRFQYGTTTVGRQHGEHRSLRQVRGALGLAI